MLVVRRVSVRVGHRLPVAVGVVRVGSLPRCAVLAGGDHLLQVAVREIFIRRDVVKRVDDPHRHVEEWVVLHRRHAAVGAKVVHGVVPRGIRYLRHDGAQGIDDVVEAARGVVEVPVGRVVDVGAGGDPAGWIVTPRPDPADGVPDADELGSRRNVVEHRGYVVQRIDDVEQFAGRIVDEADGAAERIGDERVGAGRRDRKRFITAVGDARQASGGVEVVHRPVGAGQRRGVVGIATKHRAGPAVLGPGQVGPRRRAFDEDDPPAVFFRMRHHPPCGRRDARHVRVAPPAAKRRWGTVDAVVEQGQVDRGAGRRDADQRDGIEVVPAAVIDRGVDLAAGAGTAH